MLKGYAVPLSPLGKASLTPPPPWHYAGDALTIDFWAEPKEVERLLPPGLTIDEKDPGRCSAIFIDWQFSAQAEELLDPARYQYREAFVLVCARYGAEAVNWCPYIYVDNDAALARGWAQGFPKKLGSVFQTRSFAVKGSAAAPVAAGSRFGASLSVHGQRLMKATLTLKERVADPIGLFTRPTVMRRYFPQLSSEHVGKPAVDELTMSLTDDLTIGETWKGDAELTIPVAEGEELHAIAPKRVGSGYRYAWSYSVTDLKTLEAYAV